MLNIGTEFSQVFAPKEVRRSTGFDVDGVKRRIVETGVYDSQIDRDIALRILEEITIRLELGEISQDVYNDAINALDDLVPRKNEKGQRQIADIKISPLMEETIKSRLTSQEVNISALEGSWGQLPDVVKHEIVKGCSLIMELTTNCTVRCSFCALADKGAIQKKMSFWSIVDVINFFNENQPKIPGLSKADSLYWGTDPFDAKWSTGIGELDYFDLAKVYWGMVQGLDRFLYTSTAIPIGEEMRVLRFADEFIRKKRQGLINQFNRLRISLTNANAERVKRIGQILKALHDEPIGEDMVDISNNRHERIAKRGKVWFDQGLQISIWDITGPNCRDGVIIGVNSVDGVIMQAASNEMPKGEDRFPIIEDGEDGRHYFIPRHLESPDLESSQLKQIYPDPAVIKITINPNSTHISEETIENNPHRAFLRIIGFLGHMALARGGHIDNITEVDKAAIRESLSKEFQLVQEYLDSGAENISMEVYMKMFRSRGYI